MAKKNLPSPEDLRQLLIYEPETGKLFWKPRDVSWFAGNRNTPEQNCKTWNTRHAGKEACATPQRGYKIGNVLNCLILAHRAAWAIHYGKWPDETIDHINGNRSDNRIVNLRDVSHHENMKNVRTPVTNTSGHIGVTLFKPNGKWVAGIKVNGKRLYLGYFDTIEEAVAVRKAAEAKYGFHPLHGRVQTNLAPSGK